MNRRRGGGRGRNIKDFGVDNQVVGTINVQEVVDKYSSTKQNHLAEEERLAREAEARKVREAEARKAEARKAEEERLAKEKEIAEAERLAKETAIHERENAERLAREAEIQKEMERLAKEQEEMEAKIKKKEAKKAKENEEKQRQAELKASINAVEEVRGKILILTYRDNNNSAYLMYQTLKEFGLEQSSKPITSDCVRGEFGYDVEGYKGLEHPFNYPKQLALRPSIKSDVIFGVPTIVNIKNDVELMRLVKMSEIIVLYHSTYFIVPYIDWKRKKVIVVHTGTTYKLYPEQCNKLFNPIANLTLIQTANLLGRGAKNERLFQFGVDIAEIEKHLLPLPTEYKFAHYPTNYKEKGTQMIIETVNQLREARKALGEDVFRFDYSNTNKYHLVDWKKQLERMNLCECYLESCAEDTEWRNSALEASVMGKVVITNSALFEKQRQFDPTMLESNSAEYGKDGVPFFIANNNEELQACLETVLEMTSEELAEKQKETRRWVEGHVEKYKENLKSVIDSLI